MTATEELRRMLDERGVEWRDRVWGGKHSVTTFWHARGVRWHYRENRFGELRLHADGLAPEQAIAATLGDSDTTGARQRDAVEVVRCRDCACFSVDDSDHDYRTGWWCKRWYTDMVMPDGFCAWACRKTEEKGSK